MCGDFMTIGERISQLRSERNISQGQLANLLGISRQAVSKWENDLSSPDTLNLIKIADVLDTDVEYLATGKHSMLKASPQIITVEKPVEIVVEKIIEKPVYIEKIIEKEIPYEVVIEKPVTKKIYRTKYIRNPIEFVLIGVICFILGVLSGLLF